MNPYRIFLSSPGDCKAERQAVGAVICKLNADPLVQKIAKMELIAWDLGQRIPMDAARSPQTSVNANLAVPESCNLFIGIFRNRIGTPLPNNEFRKNDGSLFESGSEYELYRATEARRRGHSNPEILVYRHQSTEGKTADVNADQLAKLNEFFNRMPFNDAVFSRGSITKFVDTASFELKFESDLRALLSKLAPGQQLPLQDWLRNWAKLFEVDAGPRYTADAHLSTNIGTHFDWLLGRPSAVEALDLALGEVYKKIPESAQFDAQKASLYQYGEAMQRDETWWQRCDFEALLMTLGQIEKVAWIEHAKIQPVKLGNQDAPKQDFTAYNLEQLLSKVEDARELLTVFAPLMHKRALLLVGPAGQGKTHTLVHQVKQTLDTGGQALGVLGQMLTKPGPIWDSILTQQQWQGSVDALLNALDNHAAATGQRALIVFDALNETPDRTRWRTELAGIAHQILRRPNLVIAISVRSDYLTYIVPEPDLPMWVKVEHPGFAEIEPDALAAYFEHYGVTAPPSPPLGEFGNPLYVQLLAKSLKGKTLRHHQPSWLEVWRAWMAHIDEQAVEAIPLSDHTRPESLQRLMGRIAKAMLDASKFRLSRAEVDQLAEEVTSTKRSISFLCSAGALIDHRDHHNEEWVEFGFERLSDTFLIDQLLSKLFEQMETQEKRLKALRMALLPSGILAVLGNSDCREHPLWPRRAGLLEALCLAAPKKVGAEMPALMPVKHTSLRDRHFDRAFVHSFRWRSSQQEYGASGDELYQLWRDHSLRALQKAETVDELIRFALIPGHVLGMTTILHPVLKTQISIGARDAGWSIRLPDLWGEGTAVWQLVRWASKSGLDGVTEDLALPAAQLLAWICSSSQREMREQAMRGLTRLLAAAPNILAGFLPDFLQVDDPYIVEATLIALAGAMQHPSAKFSVSGSDIFKQIEQAARLVYEAMFAAKVFPLCHLTIRHYARTIVEAARAQGMLPDVDAGSIKPPYRSRIDLDQVPNLAALEKCAKESKGFHRILYSVTELDFYLYEMGGNSGSLQVSSTPMRHSSEPKRPFIKASGFFSRGEPEMFDLALASRFIAFNALALGYTAERFDEFDSRQSSMRMGDETRTERIGKKYQWIGWHILLAFLTDHYQLRPGYKDKAVSYSRPRQLYVNTPDPGRWLQEPLPAHATNQLAWIKPIIPKWPKPNPDELRAWINSSANDLPPNDVIECCPVLPKSWGPGRWIRLAANHLWETSKAPGHWRQGAKFRADLWWFIQPVLIKAAHVPMLISRLRKVDVTEKLAAITGVEFDQGRNVSVAEWLKTNVGWDDIWNRRIGDFRDNVFPVSCRRVVGICGDEDNRNSPPQILPAPSIFREWQLLLDQKVGLISAGGMPLFGLADAAGARNVLYANLDVLMPLLQNAVLSVAWFFRGERRAFRNLETHGDSSPWVWADYRGVGLLSAEGRVETLWLDKELKHPDL